MPQHTNAYGYLKTFINALGGSLNDDDINAASDTEEGKHLLVWLAHQAAFLDDEEDLKNDTILRDVALEKDEIPFYSRAIDSHHENPLGSLNLDGRAYLPPSKLRKQAAFIKDENDLVQRQIDVLTMRISKTKEASKALVQSIKSLQRVAHSLDVKIRSEEATVAKLSFNTDCMVTTTISNTKEAFRFLSGQTHAEADQSEVNSDLASTRVFLIEARNRISRISNDLRSALDFLSSTGKEQPMKIRDIENETSRLQAAFHGLDIHEDDGETEYELQNICLLLEQEGSKGAETGANSELLKALLSETDDGPVDGWVDHRSFSVQDVLHHAWIRDQFAGSLAENTILDGASTSLNSAVEPLQSLRSSILPLVSSIREVEAVVEAFIEELADITIPEADVDGPTSDLEDTEMEENLRRVLSENQDLRPGGLPLVLMTRDDILAELQEIRNRIRNVEVTERAHTEDLIRLATARPLHNAMPGIYAHSPLHSSPPFGFPPDVQDLEARVRKITGELQAIADSVEEEFKSSFAKDSNMKRLDAFVEKWTDEK